MGACSTCRFWSASADGRDVYDRDADDGFGGKGNWITTEHRKCVAVIHGNGSVERERSGMANVPAMVCDGSGYAATLYTLPTFGCTLHEVAATPPPQ